MNSELQRGIVKVGVPRPIWPTYDYAWEGAAAPPIGGRVQVPLGHSRTLAVVLAHVDSSPYELKSLIRVFDTEPLIPPDLIQLAQWLSSYYHYPVGAVLEAMMPVSARRGHASNFRSDRLLEVSPHASVEMIKRGKRLQELFEYIETHGQCLDTDLVREGFTRSRIESLLDKELIREIEIERSPFVAKPPEFEFTPEQSQAINTVSYALGNFEPFLLDGVTGSGKTEVYLRVIEETIRRGQQALVLVPEISLAPQTVKRFEERFANVGVLHSMLPDVQRFRTWCRTANGTNDVLIGTRSALFTPFRDLGVIIVDEEHDQSYKQASSLRYSARDVAVYRARTLNIPVLLGSATPSLESLVNVEQGRYRSLKLPHRPGVAEMPKMYVQDMRNEPIIGGICQPLLDTIATHVANDAQVLVLINRRGYLPRYFCHVCNWTAMCNRCEYKLTLHEHPTPILRCHQCLYEEQIPPTCPECGKSTLKGSGTATQRIEETLRERFPNVPITRVDRDNVRSHQKLKSLFSDLATSSSGIIVGTQMLSKGHHLPNVTLVAVVGADGGFLSTDYRGPERTAQLIVQVAGRAGREDRPGEVCIQTFDPENLDLQCLVQRGYHKFMETESAIRKKSRFPPFAYMAALRAEGTNAERTQLFIQDLVERVKSPETKTLGPVEAPVPKVAGKYRFQAAVLSESRRGLHAVLSGIEKIPSSHQTVHWSIDVDPSDLST